MAGEYDSFEKFGLNRQLLNAIGECGYHSPTPVQQQVIPRILAGHDLFGIAPTGTGKTAAYLIPLILKLRFAEGTQPRALVLVPTRELAIQVNNEAAKLSKFCGLRHTAFYGGTGIKMQSKHLENGIDLIISTPGRFLDIYKTGAFDSRMIKTLVIDEADKMMDMGFFPQLKSILEIIPPRKRQNLLFSATLPEKVERLSDDFLEFPLKIEIKPQATPADTIEQIGYLVPNIRTKISLLEYLLRDKEKFNRVIIFCKTKQSANDIYKYIYRKVENKAKVIHANKDQNTRINAIESFRMGESRILVSTDLTARGIDISTVSHVINFDVPVPYEEYVHRIGRTGRAKRAGIAITFVNPPDSYHFKQIEKLIKQSIPMYELPAEIQIFETEAAERQLHARETDRIKKRIDPDFKGAFHEKKEIRNARFKKNKKASKKSGM